MNRTILSLAILKTNWHKLHKDYLENFVPFVATLIVRKKYSDLDPKVISDDFRTEFGLLIPIFPTISILKRAATRNLLNRDHGKFIPKLEKAVELDFTAKSLEQQRELEKVLSELKRFASDRFSIPLDDKTAGDALVGYLREHDLDILFAAETQSPLPNVSNPKRIKYVVNSFVKECFQREPSLFRFILDITVGHALAATVLYKEFNSFSGKLNNVSFYFDTRFVIRLVGLEGIERQASAVELVKSLSDEKANLRIFDKTYREIEGVLYDCIDKLQKGNVDVASASRVLRHFITNNRNSADVEQLLVALKSRIAEHNIHIEQLPEFQSLQLHQIDEEALLKLVLESYSSTDPEFDKVAREAMVRRDVEVVSGIFRLRQGVKPRSIKESKAIFVTPNNGLAAAIRRFEVSSNVTDFFIPTCVTDVFVGTLLWLQSPAKVQQINERKIIADCYAALQPSEFLIKKYVEAVDQMKASGRITTDEYYLLRTHRAAINLLEEKTLGDPDAFDDKTPEEILDDIKAKIKNEEKQKFLQEKELHAQTKAELDQAISKQKKLELSVEARAEQLAKLLSNGLTVLLLLIIILSLTYRFYPALIPALEEYKNYLLGIGLLLSLTTLFVTVKIKHVREKMRTWFSRKIVSFFKGNAA